MKKLPLYIEPFKYKDFILVGYHSEPCKVGEKVLVGETEATILEIKHQFIHGLNEPNSNVDETDPAYKHWVRFDVEIPAKFKIIHSPVP